MATIFQFWDRNLPAEAEPFVASWQSLNPDFEHRLYDESEALNFIQQNFGRRHAAAFKACRLATMKSDLFRYCALHAFGGVYADIDIRCLRPIAELYHSAPRGVLLTRIGDQSGRRLFPTGFCAFRQPADKLMQCALEYAVEATERRDDNRIYYTTGPGVLADLFLPDSEHSRQLFEGLQLVEMVAAGDWLCFERPRYQTQQTHWSVFEKDNSIFVD